MRVFISWSGNRSKAVAELLRDWIKCVLQATRPWISSRDLDRGSLWFSEINDQLRDTAVGVICLTKENKERPWILFEAGALAKGLSSNRVCTFLVDLKSSDLGDPLAQFNHTFPVRESVLGLIRTLNNSLSDGALDDRILQQVFDTYWPQFEKSFGFAVAANASEKEVASRSDSSILEEILDSTRMLTRRVSNLESVRSTDRNVLWSSLGEPAITAEQVELAVAIFEANGRNSGLVKAAAAGISPLAVDHAWSQHVARRKKIRPNDDLPASAP